MILENIKAKRKEILRKFPIDKIPRGKNHELYQTLKIRISNLLEKKVSKLDFLSKINLDKTK